VDRRPVICQAGMAPSGFLSTFPSIDTSVDGIKFSEGLERLAQVIDRGTLIRSYTAGDLGFILHSRHQYQRHIGLDSARQVEVGNQRLSRLRDSWLPKHPLHEWSTISRGIEQRPE
jgi:hypothetical protein